MTAVEAKKLVIEREDELIGHKRIIYVIDQADQTKEPTRKVTIDFFKVSLGFTDDEILFCDNKQFPGPHTNFSAETWQEIKKKS